MDFEEVEKMKDLLDIFLVLKERYRTEESRAQLRSRR